MRSTYGSIQFDEVNGAAQGSNGTSSEEWFDGLMQRPGLMLALLGLCTAAEWIAITPFGQSWCPGYAANVAEWLRAPAMWLFLCWSIAVYLRDGDKRLGWLWTAWIGGWGLFVGWIAFTNPAFIQSGLTLNQMLVPSNWWGTMGSAYSPGECYMALAVLALVLDICAGFRVTKLVLIVILCYILRIADAFD